MAGPIVIEALQAALGERVEQDVPLERYTSARIGGPADVLVTVGNVDELAEAVEILWRQDAPFLVLGGGSNVLVSDGGVRGVVVLNKARKVRFEQDKQEAWVWAESGANFGALARQAAQKGYGGLEWAAGVPGTVGGAIFGNAGAHGGDAAGSLRLADILHREGSRRAMTARELEFDYRSSLLKRQAGEYLVLAASFHLELKPQEEIEEKMNAYLSHRRSTQPPGASMGSMFKNPEGDYAGRLVDAAGLKGTKVGGARISELHGNFFTNEGDAKASDVFDLIEKAQDVVKEKFGVELELEIELVGEWPNEPGVRR
ncbi:MAG: UDP-N-acetylmuramate dehydrogenase [Anaerolineae bacterium]|nr:UDP-N-acetylmuramate dehydrogenase [Anaerolineae bacterium]